MSPAVQEQPLQVASLGGLQIGPKGRQWALPEGLYTVEQIVEANAPLLETCIFHLGPSPQGEPSVREMLIDNLASNLDLNTREASISIPTGDPARAELAEQAVKIGKTLIGYVRNVTDVKYDPDYVVRSPCEGHLLKPPVSQLMFGPRSLRHLMQIYNEYLHQMVLLRDALLPFENYEEVLIPIIAGPKRGLRHTEDARGSFLTEVLTKQVKQRSLLKMAQSLLAPKLPGQSDVGFQYTAGTVLPAFIAGGHSARLLRYVPALLDGSVEEATFHYLHEDYYTADRSELSIKSASIVKVEEPTSSLTAVTNSNGERQLQLILQWANNSNYCYDLGQIARGYRYAFWAKGEKRQPDEVAEVDAYYHSAQDVLQQSAKGLLMPPSGTHAIRSKSKIHTLALLGQLYPENILVVEQGQSITSALSEGRGGFPDAGRFVIVTDF